MPTKRPVGRFASVTDAKAAGTKPRFVALGSLLTLAFTISAIAGQVGELSPPQNVAAGEYAYIVPPIENGQVVASAPYERWILRGGPFINNVPASLIPLDCDEAIVRAQVSTKRALEKARLAVSQGPILENLRAEVAKGMAPEDAIAKTTNDLTTGQMLAKLQADYGRCIVSDGSSPEFRFLQTIKLPNPEEDLVR
jgi:hypothetical protein